MLQAFAIWIKHSGAIMIRAGNIGVITTIDDQTLFEITAIQNGLVYCLPLIAPFKTRVCLPDQFWVLLDSF
jgi:hypothetical protein